MPAKQRFAKKEMPKKPPVVVDSHTGIPEFRGLTIREALRVAKKAGINIGIEGSGFATGKTKRDRREPKRLIVQFDPRASRDS